MLLLHNLADVPVTVDIGKDQAGPDRPWEVFADSAYRRPTRAYRKKIQVNISISGIAVSRTNIL